MTNPYTSPQSDDDLSSATPTESALARSLLERRECGVSWGYYLSASWKRQLFDTLLYGALFAFAMVNDTSIVAWCVAAFYLGQRMRDMQWWRALCSQWPVTQKFLDWKRIEQFAEEVPAEARVLDDE